MPGLSHLDDVALRARADKILRLSAKQTCRPPADWVERHEARPVYPGPGHSHDDEDLAIDYEQWRDLPPPRTKFSLVTYDGKIIIFGGGYQRTFQADLYEYTVATKTWRCIHEDASIVGGPCHRRSHKVVRRGNTMILFGGRLVYRRRGDVYALNLDTYQWKNVTPGAEKGPAPVDRAAHSAVLWRNYMVVFGGDRDSGEGQQAHLNDLWQLDLDTYTWKELKPTGEIPSGRLGHDSVVSGDTMYLFGGYQGMALNDMYAIDLSVGVWRAIDHMSELRVHPTSFLSMVGQPAQVTTVAKRAPQTPSAEGWPHVPRPTEEAVCAALYLWGGAYTDMDRYTDKLYRFDVATELFEPVPTSEPPAPRLGHSLSVIGNELVLFGGCNSTYYNDLHTLSLAPPSLQQIMRHYILAETIPYAPHQHRHHLPRSTTSTPEPLPAVTLSVVECCLGFGAGEDGVLGGNPKASRASSALHAAQPPPALDGVAAVGTPEHHASSSSVSTSSSSSGFFYDVDDAETSLNTLPSALFPFSPASSCPAYPPSAAVQIKDDVEPAADEHELSVSQ